MGFLFYVHLHGLESRKSFDILSIWEAITGSGTYAHIDFPRTDINFQSSTNKEEKKHFLNFSI